jgi:hypothetical protein
VGALTIAIPRSRACDFYFTYTSATGRVWRRGGALRSFVTTAMAYQVPSCLATQRPPSSSRSRGESPAGHTSPNRFVVRTLGAANRDSLVDARLSCSREIPHLRRSTGHNVVLIAAVPTDAYYAWTWVEGDLGVDRPSDRTSAKVCVYVGHFSYIPDVGPLVRPHETVLRVRVPLFADIQEPNGLGLGSMLGSVPARALPLVDLHSYSGRPIKWAPW